MSAPIELIAEQNVRTAAWAILTSDDVFLGSARHRHQVEETARRLVSLLWRPHDGEAPEVHITYRHARKGTVKKARES